MERQEVNPLVKLHPEAKEISFRYSYTIRNIFRKTVSPILGIDYFSLMIVDASKTVTIYSNRPSIEFNLINSGAWIYDGVFALKNHQSNAFYFWDELYSDNMKEMLLKEKEQKYGFEFGFFLMRKINDLFVIYSFATKRKESRELYKASQDVLFGIGDYFFHELKSIHRNYLSSSYLKLAIDNTKKGETV